jgi:hypothetical protein
MQALGWGFPVERFAWATVEFGGDGGELLAGVEGQVGARPLRQRRPVFSLMPTT